MVLWPSVYDSGFQDPVLFIHITPCGHCTMCDTSSQDPFFNTHTYVMVVAGVMIVAVKRLYIKHFLTNKKTARLKYQKCIVHYSSVVCKWISGMNAYFHTPYQNILLSLLIFCTALVVLILRIRKIPLLTLGIPAANHSTIEGDPCGKLNVDV